MNKLPKELSKELLSEVLKEDVYEVVIGSGQVSIKYNNCLTWAKECGDTYTTNLDTLTRLALEYIESKGYVYNLFNSTSVQGYVMIIDEHKIIGKSILEAVLKATNWVAKEKRVENG